MFAFVVVVLHVSPDSFSSDSEVVVGVQVNVLVLEAPPKSFNENVIPPTSLPIHTDAYALRLQNAGEGTRSELSALVRVEDLRPPEAIPSS